MIGSKSVFAVVVQVCAAGGALLVACSGGSNGGSNGGSGGSSSGGSTGVTGSTSDGGAGGSGGGSSSTCTQSSSLQIRFAPMYSAFVTDSTTHTFQVPAIVTGGGGATATWSASDANAVSFAADPSNAANNGTMITVKSATPSVTITAQVGTLCATTRLSITSAVDADWQAGNARYNNGIPLNEGCAPDSLKAALADAGLNIPFPPPPASGCPTQGPACTACHGPTAKAGFFQGIEHTPEQTAGFTDQELVNVIVNGTVADGGAFDNSLVPYKFWTLFHTWSDISTPEAQRGMVVYLRSLTPAPQAGTLSVGNLDAGH